MQLPISFSQSSKILWYEIFAFVVIITLSWADEVLSLPSLLFGGTYLPDFRESGLETVITLTVAIPFLFLTRRLLSRLHYLEGFVRVCAWCQRIDYKGKWVPLAEYFQQHFATETSHGICPACVARMRTTPP